MSSAKNGIPAVLLRSLLGGAVLVLALGCGGNEPDGEPGYDPGLEGVGEELLAGESPAAAPEEPVPGFAALDPSCPFPYRLQYPREWTLTDDVAPSSVALDAGSGRSFALVLQAEEGGAPREAQARMLEISPDAEQAGEVTVGGERVTVYRSAETGRRNLQRYLVWVPAERFGGDVVMWSRLHAQTVADSGSPIEQETVLRILDTLERQECT